MCRRVRYGLCPSDSPSSSAARYSDRVLSLCLRHAPRIIAAGQLLHALKAINQMMAQKRYSRLMVVANQQTIPAHEQVFRAADPDKRIGGDRVSAHLPSHEQRIDARRQQSILASHIGSGPYNDKRNNMYMRCWVPGLMVEDKKPVHKLDCHYDALTPWHGRTKWAAHQRTACPAAQARVRADRAAAVPDKAGVTSKVARLQAESHRSTLFPWREGYTHVLTDKATGQLIRGPWRKAGVGVMGKKVKHGKRAVRIAGDVVQL